MHDPDPCELCGTLAETTDSGGWGVQERCPRCGEFRLTGTAMMTIRNIPQADKAKFSGWVRDQNILGEIPELSDDRIVRLLASPMPGIRERADRARSSCHDSARSSCHDPQAGGH